ncbi:CPBP family intramembrane metalloprotease [Clostridium sp. 'deep sea']|uniref:CPBP family intramembrane glutamic endopeptidase n=1 Tax=Clostridium sp. 'deep sea' TaxID=2779445 RepID=UPI001896640E|nr:type II CAAX endopeptidase family protein [Clostridium sp. 'deep sea']QOR36808.1 CPBP family intramembrane metalloprotease [Clostridium sp. 'deep sea']
MNNYKSNSNNLNYRFTAAILVIYYSVWTMFRLLFNNPFHPAIQSFKTISIFFLIVICIQSLTNYFPCFLFAKLKKQSFKDLLRLNKVSLKQLLLTLVIFLGFNAMAVFLIKAQDIIINMFGLKFEMNNYMLAESLPTLIILIITAGIIIPIGEELFFRGLLIRGCEGLGIKFAIFVSAFYFAINHNNPHRLITLFLYAYLVGLIVHYTNSVIPGMVIHIITNTVFEVYTYIQGKANMAQIYSNVANTEHNILSNNFALFMVFILGSLACYIALKQLKKLAEPQNQQVMTQSGLNKNRAVILIVTALIITTLIYMFWAIL